MNKDKLLDLKLQKLMKSNIPEFLGDFESLLHRAILNAPSQFDYIDGWDMGRKEGAISATENTIKNFISSGRNGLFVEKSGKIIPYGNIRTELLKNEEVKPLIKEFLNKEFSEKQESLNNLIQSIKKDNVTDLSDSEYIENYLTEKKKEIHDIFRDKRGDHKRKKPIDYGPDNTDDYYKKTTNEINTLNQKISNQNQIRKNSPKKSPKKSENSDITFKGKGGNRTIMTQLEIENLKKQLEAKELLKKDLDKYIDDRNKYKTLTEEVEEQKKLRNATGYTWQDDFLRKYKDGEDAMLLTDQFNLYDIKKIRDIFPKEKEGTPIHKIVEKRAEYKLPIEQKKLIKDLRTKKENSKKIVDFIEVPSQKYKFNIHKQVKDKYGDIPPDVLKYIEDVQRK